MTHRTIRHVVGLTAMVFLASPGAGAQRIASLDSLRACPRERCTVALERGTVDGTRLRIGGDSGRVIIRGFLGGQMTRELLLVPAAAPEARQGERSLRNGMFGAFASMVGIMAASVLPRFDGEAREIAVRMSSAAVIGTAGILFWNRQSREADRHFTRSVDEYNATLRP